MAESVDWSQKQATTAGAATNTAAQTTTQTDKATTMDKRSSMEPISINRTIALYDVCHHGGNSPWNNSSFSTTKAGKANLATSISTRHGPLKVLARGCWLTVASL